MLQNDAVIQTLVDLGLTVLQARVYLTIGKLGTSPGRVIAKAASVASQDIYRILAELQEKGLVEKIISNPNKYKPIPVDEGCTILLRRRKQKTDDIKNALSEMFKAPSFMHEETTYSEDGQFILIPRKEPILHRLMNGFKTAKTSVDIATGFLSSMDGTEMSLDVMLTSLKHGVKFRDLIDTSKGKCPESKAFSILKKTPGYEARFVQLKSTVTLQIKDRQEVFLAVRQALPNTNTPYLWTNNPILVEVIQDWYNMKWEKAATSEAPAAGKRKAKR
jgi:predicted aspartyl protease